MAIAANLSLDHNFLMFYRQTLNADGKPSYQPYNRFPIGGYVLIALAIMPFGDDLAAQLYAARTLMLVCFAATALLAYLSLCRLTRQPWIAASATLMAFSSFYCLFYSDMVHNETGLDLLGAMLTFHGMVIFVQEDRFRQLMVKTCVALLVGWHIYALLLPFIALGLARECLCARSVPFRRKCARLLYSRYVLLGMVSLLVGLAVLTFNFANEYIALKGEKSLVELPSFQSMMYRTGMEPNVRLDWGSFLLGQFSRIGGMSTPYFILSALGVPRPPLSYVPLSVGVGLGVFVACVFGVCFTRPRIPWATLVLFGFCWALPMRHNVAALNHAFESVFYIGLPLVFFSLVLLCLSRLFKAPPLMVGFAGIALIAFALSSFQMSHFYLPDEMRRQKDLLPDATAIRRLTAEGDPIFVPFYQNPKHEGRLKYYLNRRIIHSRSLTAEGFTLMYDRLDTDALLTLMYGLDIAALLTPKNERILLYDSKGLLEAHRAKYQRVVSGELVARSTFDVYRDERALHYVKTPCSDADMKTQLFLHIFPTDGAELPGHRRLFGHDARVFNFSKHALRFDDKCLASIALPPYDIARIETGPLPAAGRRGFSALFAYDIARIETGPLPPDQSGDRAADPGVLESYRQAYQRVVSDEPMARSTFDVYLDERVLYYVKTPCSDADIKTRFFLHIFPNDKEELPDHRRQWGYDNYDSSFFKRILRFDDKCLASIALPPYDIAWIETGQSPPGSRFAVRKSEAYDIARIETGQFHFDRRAKQWKAKIFLDEPSK